jgi:predicted acetylornithine/succinylornithine family transaminase
MNSSALLKTYNRYPVEFDKGNGALLYDKNGKEYLDFLCGIAVTGFGHNNSEIKDAVLQQINSYWHVSNLFEASGQVNLANKLAARSGLDKVFFCNSGTEAVEAAIKFARKWGKGKFEIITAQNGFHGRSYGSLSATGQTNLQEGFGPMLEGFKYVPYGDLSAVEKKINSNTAAGMVESIQGEGGVIPAPEGYLEGLRKLCDEKDILLIIDEIQTGIGRTGKFFAYQHSGIIPDIVTAAKGLANGLPLGATICLDKVGNEIKPGNHGSTFGGNPVAVAAANKVMDLLDNNLLERINELGVLLYDSLHALHLPEINDIRGVGLMIGVQFAEGISAKKIAAKLLENGVLVGNSGDTVIRLLPPLIVSESQITKFLMTFKKVITDISMQ